MNLSTYFIIMLLNIFTSKFNTFNIRTKSIFRSKIQMISTSNRLTDAFPIVILEKGKARLFQDGNPLVYGGAVKEIKGKQPLNGDEVLVQDYLGNNIGRGIFNPISTYRVRMIARSYETLFEYPLKDILKIRLENAIILRQTLNLPKFEFNTVYRLVNGEGDRLGGLIIDVLGQTIVIQSNAFWVETYKTILMKIINELYNNNDNNNNNTYKIIWRQSETRLKQDGYYLNNNKTLNTIENNNKNETFDIKNETFETNNQIINENIYENNDRSEIVYENGIKFMIYPENNGQKTGYFCDQRNNRLLLSNYCNNKNILDLYSYSGGFSIYCALNNAKHITTIDSSIIALQLINENMKLNNISNNNIITIIKSDCIEYMKTQILLNNKYDIIICDPPKLAPTRKDLERARKKYIKINSLSMSLVTSNGLLFTCTCSAAVTQTENEFINILKESAKIAQKDITILSISHAASDHPLHLAYTESNYLTAILLRVL